jgi:arginine exporter protein ArgO
MLAAALVFPQGIHSDYGLLYLILSGVMNAVLLALPIFCLQLMISRRKHRQRPSLESSQ